MPDKYISRAEAIKYAEHAYHEWNLAMAAADGKREINLVYKRQELCKAVESVFRDMPAADVAPVVHGAWECWENEALIGVSDSGRDIWRRCRYYQCSVCGKRTVIKANYCAYCGAKMDGGERK